MRSSDFEKITGSAITRLFDALTERQSLLKLTLVDADYQSLARILGLTHRKKTPHFVLDLPEGFEEAAADLNVWQIQFEFSGIDHIKYAFTTFGGQIFGQRLYLPLPQELARKQRRELFRLDAPSGTRLCFLKDANRFELEVMNISIGGSLAAWVQTNTNISESSPLAAELVLEDVELVFPTEIMRRPLLIEAVEIKRIKRDPEKQRYELGFEFCKINTDEKKRLTDLIYELQRQYLRQRLPLDL